MFATDKRSIFLIRPKACVLNSTLAIMIVALLSAPVAAQRFKSINPKMSSRASKSLLSQAVNAMRTPAGFQAPGGQDSIKKYFRTYYFPKMTLYGPANLSVLGKMREDLFKRYLRPVPVKEAQDFLTKETLGIMRVLARDNYHPAVRFNAVLILGMLDQQYAGKGTNPTPPVPLPAATNELLELLEKEEFNNIKVPPQVKVGALEGLVRHLRFGIDPQYADRVTKAAMAVLAQDATSIDASKEVHDWMKCQAANVLIQQTKDNPNAEVQAALTKLIADKEIGLDDRCHIVGLLQSMDYSKAAGAGLDLSAVVLPVGNLTQSVVDAGSKKATEYIDLIIGKNPGVGRGGYGGGGYGRGGGGSQEKKLERSQLVAQLKQIGVGSKSLSDGLADEDKQKLGELMTALAPVVKLSGNKKSIDVEVAEKIVDLEGTIDTIVAKWQPVAAAAADNVDFAE